MHCHSIMSTYFYRKQHILMHLVHSCPSWLFLFLNLQLTFDLLQPAGMLSLFYQPVKPSWVQCRPASMAHLDFKTEQPFGFGEISIGECGYPYDYPMSRKLSAIPSPLPWKGHIWDALVGDVGLTYWDSLAIQSGLWPKCAKQYVCIQKVRHIYHIRYWTWTPSQKMTEILCSLNLH